MKTDMFGGGGEQFFASSKFLIVDDFQGMRSMLATVLRNCGANAKNIDYAATGAEAVNLLTHGRYDVVLCDFNLGAGQNGMQILEEARHKRLIGPSCCWIMVTAEKTNDIFMSAAEVQPDAYLVKPVTESILSGRIQKILVRKEAFIEIDQAIASKDYLKAVRLCDQRAAADKANAIELLRVKCDLLMQSGQADKAKATYEKVLAVRDVPWAQLGMAKIAMGTGDLESARNMLESLVDRQRAYLEAYDLLAEVYTGLGESERAEQVLDRALTLSPNSHARQRNMGELALKSGKLDRAEEAFRKTLVLSEHSVRKTPDTYLGLAKTVSGKANPDEALKVLAQMGKAFDGEEVCLKAKSVEGLVYQQNGQPEKAQAVAKELVSLIEQGSAVLDSSATREVAELLISTGEQQKGMELLQAEVMNNPEDAATLASVKAIIKKTGLGEEGNELVEQSRKEAMETMNAGILLAREGKTTEAITKMREALTRMPRNVRLLLNSAHVMLAHMEQKGPDATMVREVRQNLLVANQLAPTEPRFAMLMGKLEALGQA